MSQEKHIPPFYEYEKIDLDSYLAGMIQDFNDRKSGEKVGAAAQDPIVTKVKDSLEGLLLAFNKAPLNQMEGGPRLFLKDGKTHISLRKAVRTFFEVLAEKIISFRPDSQTPVSGDVMGKMLEFLLSYGLQLKEAITSLEEPDINSCILLHNALFRHGIQEAVRQVGVTQEQVAALLPSNTLELSVEQLGRSLDSLSKKGVIRKDTVGAIAYYNFFSFENPPQPK